jgi:hypothetical protein
MINFLLGSFIGTLFGALFAIVCMAEYEKTKDGGKP